MDSAVSLRLLIFDREVMENNAKLIAYEVSKIFGDGESSGNSERAADYTEIC